jgi:hypothetical protein
MMYLCAKNMIYVQQTQFLLHCFFNGKDDF